MSKVRTMTREKFLQNIDACLFDLRGHSLETLENWLRIAEDDKDRKVEDLLDAAYLASLKTAILEKKLDQLQQSIPAKYRF